METNIHAVSLLCFQSEGLLRFGSTIEDLHNFSPVLYVHHLITLRTVFIVLTVSRTRTENLIDSDTDLQRHSALRPGEAQEEENQDGQETRRRCCRTGRPQLEKQREREDEREGERERVRRERERG